MSPTERKIELIMITHRDRSSHFSRIPADIVKCIPRYLLIIIEISYKDGFKHTTPILNGQKHGTETLEYTCSDIVIKDYYVYNIHVSTVKFRNRVLVESRLIV